MPPLTLDDAHWKVAQTWIGQEEDYTVFLERYQRLLDLDLAIYESIQSQISVIESDSPVQLTTPDGLSMNKDSNLEFLLKTLKRFQSIGGTGSSKDPATGRTDPAKALPGSVRVSQLHRREYR